MRRTILITMAAIGIVACLWSPVAAQQPTIQNVTYFPPSSFEQLCSTADLVIIGRPERSSVRLHGSSVSKRFEDQTVFTTWQINVIELLRSTGPRPTSPINVLQQTGEVQVGNRRMKVDDAPFPPLRPSASYLLFLRWNSASQGYEVSYGPSGAYSIQKTELQSNAHSPVAVEIQNSGLDKLKAMVAACGR